MVVARVKSHVTKVIALVVLNSGMGVIMLCALYDHFITKKKYKKQTKLEEEEEDDDDVKNTIVSTLTGECNDSLNDMLVPSLSFYYNKLNIIVEEFKVTTSDGYPLTIWHLKDTSITSKPQQKRQPMLFIHGLLQSSASFASGGENSLAYYFNNQGYDIWLGNNRIGFHYERDKNVNDKNYWNWDMNELVTIDLPTMINFVQKKTGYNNGKIKIVGHSQGTTEIFLGLINNIDNIKTKIDTFIALSPACYPGELLINNGSKILKIMSRTIDNPLVFGHKSFIKIMMIARQLFLGTQFFGFICYLFFSYVFDWNDDLWDQNQTARHFMFSPVYVSVKLMQWWLSNDQNKLSFINHSSSHFFPEDKTWFDNELTKGPQILMVVPKRDKLVDGQRLIKHFQNHEDSNYFKYWIYDQYSHLDVLWATDIIETIAKPLQQELNASIH